MLSPSLESSLVRILTDNSQDPEGAGFLVTPKHVLTCAHVVNTALGRNLNVADQPSPASEVFLDFPLLNNQSLLRAKILHWFPVADDPATDATGTTGTLEDIAVLELLPETPLPAEARPAPLVALDSSPSFADHRLRMCGFPGSVDQGTYIDGMLKGRTGAGSWEIHPLDKTRPIEQGFSGTAVWAVKENAVCGMISSRLKRTPDQENGPVITGYMLPASALIRAFPELDQHSRPANPYRGLEAFREKDANLYFGRDKTIKRLRQVVADRPFAAVIGASGSGKSSVVFAGLLPALRKSGDWLVAHCRPKKQPLYELSACLIPLLYDDPILRSEKTDELKEKLHAGSIGLVGIIRQIKKRREQHENLHLLLVIDQFEELFTLNTDQELIRQYIGILLECLRTEQFTVLLTMRADFFAAAVSSPALAEALDNSAPIILPQIDEQGLREVVEQPAKVLSVYFEPGLIDLIVNDVGKEPGSLPLLEFCLTQLWERQEFRRISHKAYKAIGGVQQALANHADAVYAEFDEQEQEQLRHIFLKLVRPGQGTEDTRQVASLDQIRAEDRALVTHLADKRLIVTGRDEERGEETVEVVHEALIRRWQILRQWVDEEREFLVWQEKLRVLLGQWLESGKDEGALLRGLPLDEALRWRETHVLNLADGEREFIAASKKLREYDRQKQKATQQARERQRRHLAVGFVVAIMLAMLTGWQWRMARQQTLAANYNLVKVFEEKALSALKIAENKDAMLFASAALEQKVETNKIALKASSTGVLFVPQVLNDALTELAVLRGHENIVLSVAFSPDGKTIVSASRDNTLRLWEVATGKEFTVLKGHGDSVVSVAFSPDGKTIVSASADKTVRIWEVKTGRQLTSLLGHEDYVTSAAFSPDGKIIVSASWDKTVRFWEAKTGKQSASLLKHEDTVLSAAFSPDGKTIVSASADKTVRIWEAKTGKERAVFKGHESAVNSVSFSPDGKTIVSASRDNTLRLWEVATGKELTVLKGHERAVISVAFSPDGKKIVSSSFDKTVRIWEAKTGKQLALLPGHEDNVNSVAFSPNGKTIVSALWNKTVRIRDITTGKERAVFKGHENSVISVSFSPDGKTIVSASLDNTLRLWEVATGKELTVLKGHEDLVINAAFSPDGKTIVSASRDNTLRLWEAATGKELAVFKGHEDPVISVAFSPDGKLIASASADKTMRIWDWESGKEVAVLRGHASSWGNSMAFSPDGKTIASASWDKAVRIWEVATGKELAILKGHENYVFSVAFSPDGKLIASASADKTMRIWDWESGKEVAVLRGHASSWGNSMAFSPDGKAIASASRDNVVRIWEVATGKELAILKGHENYVFSVAFSPDGKTIVSASSDNTLRLWEVYLFPLFLHNSKPTPLYHTFIKALKFLWQLDVQGLDIVETNRRTPADLKKYGTLLAPPPPGQSKFDQVLEWAEKQQEL
ncbi:MAG: trypsin-like peptidase domain-containing protein [Candidatus Electrothrix communis]|nr:MAG: trypsin-like peptidase domain-containing protein [Candidatus Electrothrix communis]